MSEERKQVLKMLAEGKITADEAERLLDRLGGAAEARGPRRLKRLDIGAAALGDEEATSGDDDGAAAATRAPRYLRVEAHTKGKDHVSVRVPLQLIRTGVKLTTMLPSETSAKLADSGIDLSELGSLEGEELVNALRELTVNVNSADGDTVRVFCE